MSIEQLDQKELSQQEINLSSEARQSSLESLSSESFSDVSEWNPGANEGQEQYEHLDYNSEFSEYLTDLEMTEDIAEYIESVEELRYENWSRLSPKERVAVLNKVEYEIARIEHRPALRVDSELMPPKSLGYQSATEHKIALNSMYINANNPAIHREVIDTIIHEGRHAYQHYNVDVKCIHESMYQVEQWRENFYDPKYGYYRYYGQKIEIPFGENKHYDAAWRLYYYQPVETDARKFAGDVMNRLEQKGIVAKSVVKE